MQCFRQVRHPGCTCRHDVERCDTPLCCNEFICLRVFFRTAFEKQKPNGVNNFRKPSTTKPCKPGLEASQAAHDISSGCIFCNLLAALDFKGDGRCWEQTDIHQVEHFRVATVLCVVSVHSTPRKGNISALLWVITPFLPRVRMGWYRSKHCTSQQCIVSPASIRRHLRHDIYILVATTT